MQLYGFWRSNAAFRVKVALALKRLPYEEIEVDILSGQQFESEYADINPEQVVPTLVHGGHRIIQSMSIIEYLDELQPSPRLLPLAPDERAYARSLALVSIADAHPLIVPRVRKYLADVLDADRVAIEAWCRHWAREGLATYERLLAQRPAAPFAMGATPGIADISIAGQTVMADLYGLDLTAFPMVAALRERCFQISAFWDAHPFRQRGHKADVA